MSTEITLAEKPTEEEVAKRMTGWANFGKQLAVVETSLNFKADKIKKTLLIPTNIAEVQKAETILREAKQAANANKKERLDLTQKVDVVTARLMQPEKDLEQTFKQVEKAIIDVKLAYEKEQEKITAKNSEITNLRQRLSNYVVKEEEIFKTLIVDFVLKAYENALNQNIPLTAIEAYLTFKSNEVKENDFIIKRPQTSAVKRSYVTIEELDQMIDEIVVNNPKTHVENLRSELRNKFVDYEAALLNKEEAIKRANLDAQEKANEINNEAINEQAANRIEAAATSVVLEPMLSIKAVNKVFKIDLEENRTNARIVIQAFFSNYDKCIEKLRITKAFNLSVSNMITALEAVKKDDAGFNCEGLKWKTDFKN